MYLEKITIIPSLPPENSFDSYLYMGEIN
jgi:hypothetical protein